MTRERRPVPVGEHEAAAYEQWLTFYLRTKRYRLAARMGWPQPHHTQAAAVRLQNARRGQLVRRSLRSGSIVCSVQLASVVCSSVR